MSAAQVLPPTAQSPHAIIEGPMDIPALGFSIGVNLLGLQTKICSFDCAYCDLGFTEVRLNKLKESNSLPSIEEILKSAQNTFKSIHEKGPSIQAICLSGNGEPTAHPDFREIIDGLIELRDLWLPQKPVALMTNGYNLDQRRINEAVNKLDRPFVKLDAGNEAMFKLLNRPTSRITLQKVIGGIRSLKDVTIQSMFVQGAIDNTVASEIEEWIEVIGLLKPKSVVIQGMSRKPSMSGLIACDEDTLHTIASKLERRTGLKALVIF